MLQITSVADLQSKKERNQCGFLQLSIQTAYKPHDFSPKFIHNLQSHKSITNAH